MGEKFIEHKGNAPPIINIIDAWAIAMSKHVTINIQKEVNPHFGRYGQPKAIQYFEISGVTLLNHPLFSLLLVYKMLGYLSWAKGQCSYHPSVANTIRDSVFLKIQGRLKSSGC